jgi:RecA-family ATPase
MSNQSKQIPPLQTITASELMTTEYPPLAFSIEELLPQGIFILAGSGKIGKSWLSLDMCVAVATGGKLWDFYATEGEVLYLALEDTYPRLKDRLERISEENMIAPKLHLAISSLGITDGLIEQIKDFISANPNTRLVVIDTLERIRNGEQDKSMYSCDYRDINKLREALEGNTATLLLVHHTRKMYDPDPLNTLSGSTGLVGAVDGVWVLEKEKRTEGKGKLTIANRDTEGYCFKVEFDKENCRWNFIGIDDGKITSETDENFCYLIGSFINEQWQGTATQLVDYLKQMDSNLSIDPRSISRKLESVSEQLKSNYGIDFKAVRTGKSRNIYLSRTAQMTI